ncbi:MAG: PF20097 family protein [Phycisphaerae bacterium]|nr:PF20097 family protein [Phycisphaerae bacterium]
MKCPMCENSTFESGKVHGQTRFKFKSDNSNLRETILGGRATRATRCEKCGFIAIFAD